MFSSGGKREAGRPIAAIASLGMAHLGRTAPFEVFIAGGLKPPSTIIFNILRSLVLRSKPASLTVLVFNGVIGFLVRLMIVFKAFL